MKVLLVNGSPHKNGSTNRALQEVEKTLQAAGVETEIFWIGNEPIGGCIGCGGCRKNRRVRLWRRRRGIYREGENGGRLCLRKPCPLCGGLGQYDVFSGPGILLGRCGNLPLQARGGRHGGKTRRQFGGLRAVTQVPWHFAYADRLEPVLEHGARCKRAGRGAGFRGSSDHARAGPQYGVASFVHRGRKGRGHQSACRRALPAHKFHSLNSACFIPAGSRLPGIFFVVNE